MIKIEKVENCVTIERVENNGEFIGVIGSYIELCEKNVLICTEPEKISLSTFLFVEQVKKGEYNVHIHENYFDCLDFIIKKYV